ncbi:Hsp70 family protein [Micromonospora zhanjiangensis]
MLHRALWEIGLGDAVLLPRAVAATESHAARGFGGTTAAVYTLGGTSFEATAVRATERGGFATVGLAQRLDEFGGAELDEILAEHVRTVLGRSAVGGRSAGGSAPPDLRAACARARRDLAVATETDVLVRSPAGPVRIPVTRAEYEEMIRPALRTTVDLLDRAVRWAGLAPDQLDGVLLAGGSARIPLLTELLTARFPGPVQVQAEPRTTAATGAALAGCQVAARSTGVRPARPAPRSPAPDRRHDPADRHGVAPADQAHHGAVPDRYGNELAHRRAGTLDRYPDEARHGDPTRYPADTGYGDDAPEPPPRPPVRLAPLELPKASRLALVRGRGRAE